MTLKMRMALLSGLLTAVVVLEGSILFFSNLHINEQAIQISEIEIPVLNKAHALKLTVVQTQQWLTDISATRALDGLNDGFDEAENNAKLFRTLISELQSLDQQNIELYQSMLPVFEQYYSTGKKMAQSYIDEGPKGGNKVMAQFDDAAARMSDRVDTFLADAVARASLASANQQQETATTIYYLGFGALIILIGIAALYFIMTAAISQLPKAVAALAEGDLTSNLDINRKDEVGDVMRSLHIVRGKTQGLISSISDTTGKLSATAVDMTRVSNETNDSINQLQSEAEQSATAMNEMTATVHEVASNISHAANAAQNASTETATGKKVVNETIDQVQELAHQIDTATSIIHQLEEDTKEISTVLDVIKGIADQTNLLALNAAIEAARAGEQGRGFAVVADEVRTLASRTQQSTDEINQMIEKLQSGSRKAVDTTNNIKDRMLNTVKQAGLAGSSLESISTAVEQISEMSLQIASAAEEQSAVAEEVNQNIIRISDMANSSAQSAEHSATTSNELDGLAEQLRIITQQYNV